MNNLDRLKNQKVGILGFGQEGQAVLKYLTNNGVSATVYDQKDGEDYLDSIGDCNILFRSPGVWRKHPKILEAEKAGTIITSQTKWFFENSKANIIGVTGTKGKGTTSSLIYEILKAAGKKPEREIFLTGNIGKIQPLEFLDQTTAETIVVYEMSSFQLQDLTISPYIGVCLMTTSDHLNHHKDLGEYHFAKSSITAFQSNTDIAIYNTDYEASLKIGTMGSGQKFIVSAKQQDKPGAFITGEKIIFSGNVAGEIDCSNRKLRGKHNLENIAAASLVGISLGIDLTTIGQAVNGFTGLEHRLQLVASVNDVNYYNDSISTVPETTIAAINSFTEPIHLILGGSDKGLDYTEMVNNLASRSNIASISLLGEVGSKLKDLFEVHAVNSKIFGPHNDFKVLMEEIKKEVKSGDVVLLSPGSASFDMFKNYADRGNQFAELAQS